MPLRIGKYRVDWIYDPERYVTNCIIVDSEDNVLVNASSKRVDNAEFDKVRARITSFNKALKKISANNILNGEEIKYLRKQFMNLPNKGVI